MSEAVAGTNAEAGAVVAGENQEAAAPSGVNDGGNTDLSLADGGGLVPGTPDFFVDEVVSDAELMGEDLAEGETNAGDQPGPDKTDKAQPKGDDDSVTGDDNENADTAAAKAETDDNKDANEKDGGKKKPPEGFVPYQALNEERTKRQTLAQQNADLVAENEVLKANTDSEGEVEEFKVLSDAEFDKLADNDPQEAIKYDRKLAAHQRETRRQDAEQDQINVAADIIQQTVPGIYDEGSDSGMELGNFAVENGLDPQFLTLLTDPRTKVIAEGSKGALLMGEGAASVVSLLNNLRTKTGNLDSVKQEMEKSLRKTITAELITKFKGGNAARSILDVPGDAGDEMGSSGPLTEAQFSKLSPAEQEKLLGA